jgi:3-oxoacyl-ACP reductase-like protein
MGALTDLHILAAKIRSDLNNLASTRRAISQDSAADFATTSGPENEGLHKKVEITPRANFTVNFPEIKSFDEYSATKLSELRDVLDLDKVMVITGFAEVGPFGSARTRWEMEAKGSLTNEGLLELAFVMGLIQHFDGQLKTGKQYVGWVDAKTKEPVDEKDVRATYEKHILEHTGVRLIEPDMFKGYDPNRKGFTQEIELQHDLEQIETSSEEATKFKLEHGDKVDVWEEGDKVLARFKKGAKARSSQPLLIV